MPSDVLQALRDFVTRIDALDPAAASAGELTVDLAGRGERLVLREPVAAALVAALAAYQDPRDHGVCAHCGGLLDGNFACASCGVVNGIFGQALTDVVMRRRAIESS
ncbi:hypothetical protein [Symbioplanes lichenis]|uniref:hypothetical protein n=1 Tax=Symbioplanes lichenis TaxID=1629072 RepID=UPI0027382243|nr:hypothetical protein [Actinoplanes lichenis]